MLKCVNPLSIGTPISTVSIAMEGKYYGKMCQSPIHRDTHFYFGKIGNDYVSENVSIPYPSGHPFLPSPSKLLDFMRPPSLDFAGIYQTILTKGLFLGF